MRILLAMSLTFMLLAGCADPEARQRADTLAAMDEALKAFAAAEAGFVPAESASIQLADYRQQKLQEAAGKLQVVLRSSDPQQQSAAQRLLAAVEQSAAEHRLQHAQLAAADLMLRSNAVFDLLRGIERADARVHQLAPEDPALLAGLQESLRTTQMQRTTTARAASDLQKRIDELKQQIDGFQREHDQAMAEKSQLLTEAFTAESDRRHELTERAMVADRQAGVASANMQERVERAGVLSSELQILNTRMRLQDESIADHQRRIAQTEARQAERRSDREQAVAAKEQKVAALVTELSELSALWQQRVLEPMEQSAQQMAEAVQMMNRAAQQAPRDSRSEFELDRAGKYAAQAHGMMAYVVATGDWGRVLDIVARTASATRGDGPLMPTRASGFDANASEIRARQQDLISRARQAINEGLEVAGALVAEGGEVAAAAEQRVVQLRATAARLDQVRMP